MPQFKIYTPRGAAGEYASLACNLSTGCTNGCVYCYVPKQLCKAREVFYAPENSVPRKNILRSIQREVFRHMGENVFLCFTTDPCLKKLLPITKAVIEVLNRASVGVTILTKCDASPILPTLAAYPNNRFGCTLTVIDDGMRELWEPGAAPFSQRVASLKEAHALGLRTWASMEPVINPEQSLEIVRRTHSFVDEFKVGKMNYEHMLPPKLQPAIKAIDWSKFHTDVVQLLEALSCEYYIKQDLLEAAGR